MPQGGKILYRFFSFSDGPVAAVLYQTLWDMKRLEAGVSARSHKWPPPLPRPVSNAVLMVETDNLYPTFVYDLAFFLQFVSTKHCYDFYLTGHIFIYSKSHLNFYLKQSFSDCAECWVVISCVPLRLLCGISPFLNW